jgi:hypothetical protein
VVSAVGRPVGGLFAVNSVRGSGRGSALRPGASRWIQAPTAPIAARTTTAMIRTPTERPGLRLRIGCASLIEIPALPPLDARPVPACPCS